MDQATISDSKVFDLAPGDPAAGAGFRISVGWPDAPPPEAGYPVVIVLDGTRYFPVACVSARSQARRPVLTHVDPALIVGVDHLPGGDRVAQRLLHLTPEAPPGRLRPRPNGQAWPETGGAALLRNFLRDDLIPRLCQDYAIDRSRISLFGHSLGGLFTLDCLIAEPDLFSCYLISSPSLWFADGIQFERLARLSGGLPQPRQVQLTIGSLEQTVPAERQAGVGPAYVAWVEGNQMVDHAHRLARDLAAIPGVGLKFRVLEDETHITAPLVAIGQGLRVALCPPNAPKPLAQPRRFADAMDQSADRKEL